MSKKGKILLIEDDQLMIKLYKTKFDLEGYELNIAKSGPKGLKSASSDPPDVILLDIVMPRMNGYEILRRLKRDPKTKNIPVLILSALSGEAGEVQKAKQLGALDFIKKSAYTTQEVVDKVQTVLERKED